MQSESNLMVMAKEDTNNHDPEKLKDLFVFSDASQSCLDGCPAFKTSAT
jgi:hypothetical protein